jgi:hypothetical protein
VGIPDLLRECAARGAQGDDFETIWQRLLRGHPRLSGALVTPAYGGGLIRSMPPPTFPTGWGGRNTPRTGAARDHRLPPWCRPARAVRAGRATVRRIGA